MVSVTRSLQCRLTWLPVVVLCFVGPAPGWGQQEKLVSKVEVQGAQFISPDVILAKMATAPGKVFSPAVLEQDRRKIEQMPQFESVTVATKETPQGVEVTVTVHERQRITDIRFVGNVKVSDEDLLAEISTQKGQPADAEAIRRDVQRITEYYSERGYLCAIEDASVDTDTGVLTFVIVEKVIEEIKIEGLKKTDEWVVRRELEVKPGEPFNRARIQRDRQRLVNLGLFEEVVPDLRAGTDPLRSVILIYKIKEKRTGMVSVGAGYSNLDKFVGFVTLSETNFRGKAERISVSGQMGGRQSVEFSFYKPWLDKHRTSVELNLYNSERRRRFFPGTQLAVDEDRFRERRKGGNIAVTRPFARVWRGSVRYRNESVSAAYLQLARDVPGGVGAVPPVNAAQAVIVQPGFGFGGTAPSPPDNPELRPDKAEPGDVVGPVVVYAPLHRGGDVASLSFSVARDTRDLIAKPTQGSFHTWQWEWASSALGGDVSFNKLMWDARYYKRPFKSRKDVLAGRLLLGTSLGDLPLFDTFSIGGADTLRGYREDRFRGENMFLASVEYRYWISKSLTAVGFVDVGDAYGGRFETVVPGFVIRPEHDDFTPRVGIGAGVRVDTPLGPIRLDLGFGDDGSRAHFSFGQTF